MDITEATTLALALMDQHGLLARGWHFQFDSSKRRNGYCQHSTKTVSLGRSYASLNREELVRDTILHEIAHALVGVGHGHGNVWKLKCIEVGAMPVRCKDPQKLNVVQAETDWYSICTKCGARCPCFRKPRFRGREYHHTSCGKTGKIRWFYKGREYDNWGVPVPEQKAADQPKPVVTAQPTQAEINELWARLDKLEGK